MIFPFRSRRAGAGIWQTLHAPTRPQRQRTREKEAGEAKEGRTFREWQMSPLRSRARNTIEAKLEVLILPTFFFFSPGFLFKRKQDIQKSNTTRRTNTNSSYRKTRSNKKKGGEAVFSEPAEGGRGRGSRRGGERKPSEARLTGRPSPRDCDRPNWLCFLAGTLYFGL